MNNLYLIRGLKSGKPVTLYIASLTKGNARAAAKNLEVGIKIQIVEKMGKVYLTEMSN